MSKSRFKREDFFNEDDFQKNLIKQFENALEQDYKPESDNFKFNKSYKHHTTQEDERESGKTVAIFLLSILMFIMGCSVSILTLLL